MIITIVCDVLGEPNNGTTIAAFNLINALKSYGHTVRVVCPDEDKKDQENYFVVPTIDFKVFNKYVEKNGVSLSKADVMIIARAIKGSDVVHVMLPFALSSTAIRLCKKFKIPVTAGFHAQAENVTSHFFLKDVPFANRMVYKTFFKKIYSKVDAVHYPTNFIRRLFEKSAMRKTNAYVISNGVNERFVQKNVVRPEEFKNKILILFCGRYSKEKAHTTLIKAVLLSKYEKDIQLIFAGAGPEEKHIIEAGNLLTNKPYLEFFSREKIVDIINMCDLYCHPAEIEIEAISCLEAITCGLVPVIADSERSATRFFALGKNNLFKNTDCTDLAKKIDYWLDNPDLKKKCSEEYLGYTKQFNQSNCMKQMEEMLVDVVEFRK